MSISASVVMELREKTGAGMMDCKKALEESNGDVEKAIDFLRKRGLKQAEKKVGRSANQGIIQSYIHPGSRLGVLVEINCETDFVARTEDFQEFAKDVAMQIAAANPLVVDRSELDQVKIEAEMEIYRAQAREQGKPEAIVEKMALGKLEKYYQEVCLLEQSFVKDPNKTVRDLMNEKIAKLGENMILKRFVRFQLGE